MGQPQLVEIEIKKPIFIKNVAVRFIKLLNNRHKSGFDKLVPAKAGIKPLQKLLFSGLMVKYESKI